MSQAIIAGLCALTLLAGCRLLPQRTPETEAGLAVVDKVPIEPSANLQSGEAGQTAAAWVVPAEDGGTELRFRETSAPAGQPRREQTWTIARSTGAMESVQVLHSRTGWYLVWREASAPGWRWTAQHITDAGGLNWPRAVPFSPPSLERSGAEACTGADDSLFVAFDDVNRPIRAYFSRVARIRPDGTVAWVRSHGKDTPESWSQRPVLVPDLEGGVFLAYRQVDTADRGVMVQHLSADGTPLWGDGLDIDDTGGYKSAPSMIADSQGGVILLWEDGRSGTLDLLAQRLSPRGEVLWASAGVPVAVGKGNQSEPKAISDGAGGAFAAWIDDNGGLRRSVVLQRIGPDGKTRFGAQGVPAAPSTERQSDPLLARDGSGGVLLGWIEPRGGRYDILAQRFSPEGRPLWGEPGRSFVHSSWYEHDVHMSGDGAGGFYLIWETDHDGLWDVHLLHVDAAGS